MKIFADLLIKKDRTAREDEILRKLALKLYAGADTQNIKSIRMGGTVITPTAGMKLFTPDGRPAVHLQPDADVFMGADLREENETAYHFFANDQTYNSEDFGEGDIMLGQNASGVENILWDESASTVYLRSGTTNLAKWDADSLDFQVAATISSITSPLNITTAASGEVVVNDAGADVDFRVEGDTEANLLFVDAGNDRIGIGTAPSELLHMSSSTTLEPKLRVENTNADAYGCYIELVKLSETPADNDVLGNVRWQGNNSALTETEFCSIRSDAADVTSTDEAGRMVFYNLMDSSPREFLTFEGYKGSAVGEGEVVINDGSVDIDFRVESNGSANMLLVDAGNNKIVMDASNTLTVPDGTLHVHTATAGAVTANAAADELVLESSGATGMTLLGGTTQAISIAFGDSTSATLGYVSYELSSFPDTPNRLKFGIAGGDRFFFTSSGINFVAGTTITTANDNLTLTPAGELIISTVMTLTNTGLHILDTNASDDLIIAPGSDLTADRTLTLTTGDAARTITLSGNPTLADWFDQAVKVAASPTFADVFVPDGGTFGISGNELLTFNAAGTAVFSGCSVGIGVTPTAPLHVKAASNYTGTIVADSISGYSSFGWAVAGTRKWSIYNHIGSSPADSLSFANAAAADVMAIDQNGIIYVEASIKVKEAAAAATDTAAYGQLWVKNTTPCQLWFTDDAGTDTQIV